jgi:C2 domain/Ubiquitin family
MLFYVRVRAAGLGMKTFALNLAPSDLVQDIETWVRAKQPDIRIKTFLFAGKVLKREDSLDVYDITKECTVQVMGRLVKPDEEEAEDNKQQQQQQQQQQQLPLISPPPSFSRQFTADEVNYGDVVIVRVLQAKGLKSVNYFSGKSDPYVILTAGQGPSCRTNVISRNLNPVWEETFGFLIKPPDRTLDKQVRFFIQSTPNYFFTTLSYFLQYKRFFRLWFGIMIICLLMSFLVLLKWI